MPRLAIAADVVVEQIATPSLGDHTYIVIAGDRAAVIDAQRDYERFAALLDGAGATPTAVLETHVHNDYVSGGRLLADGYGCRYLLPTGSEATLDHEPIADEGTVEIADGWHLEAIHTPGHTPHHTSYAVMSPEGVAMAIFSGGSMLIGAVGRTDLIDPSSTNGLTRDQWRSVRRLAEMLPDPTAVAPTHGAGSFCATSPMLGTSSTIAMERRQNPALTINDEERFVRSQIAGLMLYPSYYSEMAPLNRAGIDPVPPPPPTLSPAQLAAADTVILDVRPPADFAAGHVAGAVNLPYGSTAAAYADWVLPWNTPAVIVAATPMDAEAMRIDLARIGHDAVVGIVTDGLAGWQAEGRLLQSFRTATFSELVEEQPAVTIDVRDPKEAVATIPGAILSHVSAIDVESIPDGTVWVHCASGYRSAIAASLLAAAGREVVTINEDFHRYRGPLERR